MTVNPIDFIPTAEKLRAERERTGEGIAPCRRRLIVARMRDALDELDERSLAEPDATFLAVLKMLVSFEERQ